jgi:hypothetical protein
VEQLEDLMTFNPKFNINQGADELQAENWIDLIKIWNFEVLFSLDLDRFKMTSWKQLFIQISKILRIYILPLGLDQFFEI